MSDKRPEYKDLAKLPRRWFPLWTLDWYILREFLVKYSILMLVFAILFILSDVYRDVADFLEVRADWHDAVRYYACKLPGNIRFVLPISTLLGCMWTMATFGKNLEITAMRASGVSLFRCGVPILAAGLVVALANVVLNEFAVPDCDQLAQETFNRATKSQRNTTHMLAFRSSDRKRHWLFETFSGGRDQKRVTLKTRWSDAMILQLVGKPGTPQFKELVRRIFESRADQILAAPAPLVRIAGELRDRRMDISAERVHYNAVDGTWTFMDGEYVSYDRDDEQYGATRGTSIMHKDIKFDTLKFDHTEIPESPEDIMNAIKEKEELSTVVIWKVLHGPTPLPPKVKNIYWTVFFYRIAFPWSCFLAVFLGIPLATKNERTGSLLAIIAAVLVIIAYVVIAQIFLMLGKGGWVNPALAGLAPTMAFITYGVWRIVCDKN